MPYHRDVRDQDVEKALSSPAQRKVLAACIRSPLSVRDISDATGVPLASTYRQVNSLQELDLIIVERSAMTSDGKPYDLYRSRLRKASIAVDAEGSRVTWEDNSAVEDRLLHLWGQMRVAA